MDESPLDSEEEAAVERVVLDVIELRNLMGSDEAAADRLRERLSTSDDDVLKRLVSSLGERQPHRRLGELLVGSGELVLGAFLSVGGLILIVPSILGFGSRADLARYLADLALGLSSPGLSDPLVSALGFGLALFLLLAALYTLGRASRSLERSGLIVHRT